MKTRIEIDEALIEAALAAGSFCSREEAVEAGLRLVCRETRYRELLALRGQLHWEEPVPTAHSARRRGSADQAPENMPAEQ
jgi:Arc/MetJ family transcription regulator